MEHYQQSLFIFCCNFFIVCLGRSHLFYLPPAGSGRRLHGEVSCSYERLVYRVTVRQPVTPECFTHSLQLAGLALTEVKGVRMNVSGFGPLNWIAGKSVTNVIQETVLQVRGQGGQ